MRKLLKTCLASPTPQYKVYTIKWDESQSDPSNMFVWYFDDAVWMSQWDDAWDNIFWFRPVYMQDGVVTHELKTTSFYDDIDGNLINITSSASGDVMIEFPKRWIRMSKEWSIVTLSITDNPDAESDWFQYYAHSIWTWESPTIKDNFYLWAYEWHVEDNKLRSVSTAAPTGRLKMQEFIDYAKNKWAGYNIEWFYQNQYVIALYMMKYWNPDCQAVIWQWYTWWSSVQNTWDTNLIWMTWATNKASTVWRVKLFWLEDLRWNCNDFIWWLKSDTSYHARTTLSDFNADTSSFVWYADKWLMDSTRLNNTMKSIVWTNWAMFLPAEIGAVNGYYSASCQVLDNRIPYVWWAYSQWIASWLFKYYLWWTTTSAISNLTARLMYL